MENENATEETATFEIGTPQNINSTYGLMDGSGAQLQRVLEENYGLFTIQQWATFDQAYATAGQSCGMLGGSNWYHWVGVRGQQGDMLWIANSAPGWYDIYDTLSREQFNSLGPFSLVSLLPQ